MPQHTAAQTNTTNWRLEPSVTYDALCLLGILTGDPFYLEHYQETYDLFAPRLTPPVVNALAKLQKAVKFEQKGIISAFLTLYFSVTDSKSLDDLLEHVEDSTRLRQALEKSAYYTATGWQVYESVRVHIETLLRFLNTIEYEAFWLAKVRPLIVEKIDAIQTTVNKYDILQPICNSLGFRFASDEVVVYLLYYIAPHVIKIAGLRCLNDFANSIEVIARTTVHELMHPPYNWDGDPILRDALLQWQGDDFVMNNVLHHNPAYGYNTFEAYVEENVVQALDQMVNETIGVAMEARERWQNADEGMHILAAVLYITLKKFDFMASELTIRDFLIYTINSGELGAGRIKQIYDRFYYR